MILDGESFSGNLWFEEGVGKCAHGFEGLPLS